MGTTGRSDFRAACAVNFLKSMKFLLGTKGRMTQIFDAEGRVHPVTVVKTGPLTITQVKTAETDGYSAIQVGFGSRKEKNVNKALKGHLKDIAAPKVIKEIRLSEGDVAAERGSTIDISVFTEGDKVTVSAVSKGKGFQGVVKRHGFAGDLKTHGRKHTLRAPGSIGGGGRAGGRVVKGMRMAGRMGGDRITVKNLKIVAIDAANNTLFISGAIPGKPGTLVEVRG